MQHTHKFAYFFGSINCGVCSLLYAFKHEVGEQTMTLLVIGRTRLITGRGSQELLSVSTYSSTPLIFATCITSFSTTALSIFPFPESVLYLDCPLAVAHAKHICHIKPLQAQCNGFLLISLKNFIAEIIPKSPAFTFCHSSPSSGIEYQPYPARGRQLVSS